MTMMKSVVVLWCAVVLCVIKYCYSQSLSNDTSEMKVVCYIMRSSRSRSGWAKFTPNHVDTSLCTHIIYSFAWISPDLSLGIPPDYKDIVHLKQKNSNLKIILCVGGATFSDDFSEVVKNKTTVKTFAKKSAKLLRDRGFDGLDVDWEYPDIKANYTALIKALREEFNNGSKRLELFVAVSVAEKQIAKSYDIVSIAKYVDYVNLMAYDFHGSWNKIAAFNSPLKPRLSDPRFGAKYNQEWAVNKWLEEGIPPNKLILGLAFYGRAYRLSDPTRHKVGDPINGADGKGTLLKIDQIRSYPETCYLQGQGWRYKYDIEQDSVFLYTTDKWVGYDDPFSISAKTKFAMSKKLGGVFIWTIDYDDFRGFYCQRGKYPLLKAIHLTIKGMPDKILQNIDMSTQPYWGNMHRRPVKNEPYKTICYFDKLSQYRRAFEYDMSFLSMLHLCTHIVYAYAQIDDVSHGVLLTRKEDEYGQQQPKRGYVAFNSHKQFMPQVVTLLAIGGPEISRLYDNIAKYRNYTQEFCLNLHAYLRKWGFDGVDIHWYEPPNKRVFNQFIWSIHNTFNMEAKDTGYNKLVLMVSVSVNDDNYEISKISRYADLVNVRAYKYYDWSDKTTLMSPLESMRNEPTHYNQKASMQPWSMVSSSKAILGLTAAGLSFRLASTDDHEVGARATKDAVTSKYLHMVGRMAHFEICALIKSGGVSVYDKKRVGSYAYKGDVWVGYESIKSITEKVKYIISNRLGGLSFWSLDLDDFRLKNCSGQSYYPLLDAVFSAMPVRASMTTTAATTTTSTITPAPQTKAATKITTKDKPPPVRTDPPTTEKIKQSVPKTNKPVLPDSAGVIFIKGELTDTIIIPIGLSPRIQMYPVLLLCCCLVKFLL